MIDEPVWRGLDAAIIAVSVASQPQKQPGEMDFNMYIDTVYLGLWPYVHDMLAGPTHLHLRCLTASTSLTEEAIGQSRPEGNHAPRVQPSRCLLCGDVFARGAKVAFRLSPYPCAASLRSECPDLGESSFFTNLTQSCGRGPWVRAKRWRFPSGPSARPVDARPVASCRCHSSPSFCISCSKPYVCGTKFPSSLTRSTANSLRGSDCDLIGRLALTNLLLEERP